MCAVDRPAGDDRHPEASQVGERQETQGYNRTATPAGVTLCVVCSASRWDACPAGAAVTTTRRPSAPPASPAVPQEHQRLPSRYAPKLLKFSRGLRHIG